MNGLEQFTKQYPVSKTLRFELKPQGQTLHWLTENGIISSDRDRAESYKQVKKILDDYHRDFITSTLGKIQLNWEDLYQAIQALRNTQSLTFEEQRSQKRVVFESQANYRAAIASAFTEKPIFSKLFQKAMIDELIPEYLISKNAPEEERNAVQKFQKFYGYFTGYNVSRETLYTADESPTAIAYRIVNQNFLKFINNINVYETIKAYCPEVLLTAEKELSELPVYKELFEAYTMDQIFSVNFYNQVLTQEGISLYNQLISGVALEERTLRGLNTLSSAYLMQNKDAVMDIPALKKESSVKMEPLYKQILTETKTFSFIEKQFKSDKEVVCAIKAFYETLLSENIFEEIISLFKKRDFDFTKIYIDKNDLPSVSQKLFGYWGFISEKVEQRALKAAEEAASGKNLTKTKIMKIKASLKNQDYSLELIESALAAQGNNDKSIVSYFGFVPNYVEKVKDTWGQFQVTVLENPDFTTFKETENAISSVKAFLDSMIDLYRLLRVFHADETLDRDSEFYGQFEYIYELLQNIVKLYNRTRNFVTKKPYEQNKIKLTFNNAWLLRGWDENIEQTSGSMILRRNGWYYLGILNQMDKVDLRDEEYEAAPGEQYYEKMRYKYLKDVTTLIPRCAFVKDVKNHFENGNDEDFILDGPKFEVPLVVSRELYDLYMTTYSKGSIKNQKKFQKGYVRITEDEEGYKQALRMWMEFCLQFFDSYKSCKEFDFSACRDLSQFESLDQFYSTANQNIYKIEFIRLSQSKIDDLVEKGRLYVFQIYSQDMKASGKKNLNTIYFLNIFSEENLKNPIIKLDGGGEVFFREKSIDKPTGHKSGSKLVNKIGKDGLPIPEDIKNEVYLWANQVNKSLSKRAKAYLPNIIVSTGKRDIIKDRRYTEDKFLFHFSITLNNQVKSVPKPKDFNIKVQRYIQNNPDIRILGVSRGMNHLLYATLINQEGKIIWQRDFDKINNVDYYLKLKDREQNMKNAEKNWEAMNSSKELIEGYLSLVTHEIVKLMVEHNAIVIMEDMNIQTKTKYHLRDSVYQKFEKMLIDKLNLLVFKDNHELEPGGALNAYQLTNRFESFAKIGKQNGFMFYVFGGFTQNIDPYSGFINPISYNYMKGLTNAELRKDFISRFDSIRFDMENNCFSFKFHIENFPNSLEFKQKEWEVKTWGPRIVKSFAREKEKNDSRMKTVYPSKMMSSLMEERNIEFKSGRELLSDILALPDSENASFFESLVEIFRTTVQIKNIDIDKNEDYIISPIETEKGFFDSRKIAEMDTEMLPESCDAGTAYFISLKGLYLLKKINSLDLDDENSNFTMFIPPEDWFSFIQNRIDWQK